MSILESLNLAGSGMIIVILALAALALIVVVLSKLIVTFSGKKEITNAGAIEVIGRADGPTAVFTATRAPSAGAAGYSAGEVRLTRVSEQDAAVIMAIISDESGIPVNQLRFKSITLV